MEKTRIEVHAWKVNRNAARGDART
jgi:hypothetical protein